MNFSNVRKNNTKERILESATHAFAESGYHGTKMDDIVSRSGTSKGAIYFHFPGKEALFFALVGRLADTLQQTARRSISKNTNAINRVDAALEALFKLLNRHRRLAKVVLVGGVGVGPSIDQRLMKLHERFALFVKEYLDHAVSDGSIHLIDTEVTAYAWLGAINEIVVRWLHADHPEPLENSLPTIRTLLLQSLGVDPCLIKQPKRSGLNEQT